MKSFIEMLILPFCVRIVKMWIVDVINSVQLYINVGFNFEILVMLFFYYAIVII